MSQERLHRRVAGHHDIRLDGITDLLLRAPGASVLDIGCNRGMVAFEFFANGASRVDGCDNYAEGIQTARHMFCDLRNCASKFEVVDLTIGEQSLKPFGRYDIIVMLATYHKIKRAMPKERLSELMQNIGYRTLKYFGWRGTSEKTSENEAEIYAIDHDMGACGLKRIHTSYISGELGVAAIWGRV